jgi:hypothetical protein
MNAHTRLFAAVAPRLLLLALVALLAFAPAVVPNSYARKPIPDGTLQDFEASLAPWVPVADHELIGLFGVERAWGESVQCSPDGTDSQRFAALSSHVVPTWGQAFWIVSSVEATGPVVVTIGFYARSTAGCLEDCGILATVFMQAPQHGDEFEILGIANEKWQYYETSTTLLADGTVYPALGWGAASAMPASADHLPAAVSPMPAQIGFDCVSVTVSNLNDPPVP